MIAVMIKVEQVQMRVLRDTYSESLRPPRGLANPIPSMQNPDLGWLWLVNFREYLAHSLMKVGFRYGKADRNTNPWRNRPFAYK